MARQTLSNTAWTLLATAPSHFRIQNLSGEPIDVVYAGSAPSDADPNLGERYIPFAVEVRKDLNTLSLNAYARSLSPSGLCHVETA